MATTITENRTVMAIAHLAFWPGELKKNMF
jgi:hypothetical protein